MNNYWNKQNPATKATYIVGGLYTAAFVGSYINLLRVEYKVRKKIRAWERMNQSAAQASLARLGRMSKDPNTTAAELWQALEEESEFLNLIQSQPMN